MTYIEIETQIRCALEDRITHLRDLTEHGCENFDKERLMKSLLTTRQISTDLNNCTLEVYLANTRKQEQLQNGSRSTKG